MHQPVLLKEVIEFLRVTEGSTFLDGTLGLGGHTEAILKSAMDVKVIGMDHDEKALQQVRKKFRKEVGARLFLFHGNFKDFKMLKETFPVQEFDGALLDLGISSFQLDDPERGFSFMKEGPLDMRMDLSQEKTAKDLINHLSQEELSEIFFNYGEERYSKQIARIIVERRSKEPFEITLDLANLIAAMVPSWQRQKIHPATRVFQALRIAVNEELQGLEKAFEGILYALKEKGRLIVISFHSLEDRIVKRSFLKFENPCTCPKDIPYCVCGLKPLGKRVTLKPVVPSLEEVKRNPRSRSAKLRVIERVFS